MALDPLDQWADYLRRRNRSAGTIRSYMSTMGTFPDPLTCTREQAEAWWDALDGRSVASRRRMLSTVRSFYRWAQRFDVRGDDPTIRLDPPDLGRRLPRPIGRADLKRILDTADPEVRRAVALAAYAGLRVSEAASLDWARHRHRSPPTLRARQGRQGPRRRPVRAPAR